MTALVVSIVAVAGNRLVPAVHTAKMVLQLTTSHQLVLLPELVQWVSGAGAGVGAFDVVEKLCLLMAVCMQVAVYLALVLVGFWMVPVVLVDDRLVEQVLSYLVAALLRGLGPFVQGLRVPGKMVQRNRNLVEVVDGLYPLNAEQKLQVQEDGHQVAVRHLALEMLFLIRHWQSRTRLCWHSRCCVESRR